MVDRWGLEHWFQKSIFKIWGTGSQTLFIVVLGTAIQNTFIQSKQPSLQFIWQDRISSVNCGKCTVKTNLFDYLALVPQVKILCVRNWFLM